MQNNKQRQQSNNSSSISYELIPRQQSIERPKNDDALEIKSIAIMQKPKIKTPTKNSPAQSTQKPQTPNQMGLQQYISLLELQRQQHAQMIKQLNQTISDLKKSIQNQHQQNQLERKANQIYTQTFNKLKHIFNEDDINIIIQRIQTISKVENDKAALENVLQYQKQIQRNLREQIQVCHNKIQQLRTQLLRSSQNNIFSIFNSISLQKHNTLLEQINKLNEQISIIKTNYRYHNQQIQQVNSDYQNQMSNSRQTIIRIQEIQQGYQNMNKNYKIMQQAVNLLHSDQFYVKGHFDNIRTEIKSVLKDQKNKIIKQIENKQLISQLSQKLDGLIESLSTPQIAKRQVYQSLQASVSNDMLFQIKSLGQKVRENEIQIQRQKEQKLLLQDRIRQLEYIKFSHNDKLQRIIKLQNKLKAKNKRILELQNTIIDHIESQVNKEKNRNLKHQKAIQELITNSRRNNQLMHRQFQQSSFSKLQQNRKIHILKELLQSLNQLKEAINSESVPIKIIKINLNQIIEEVNKNVANFSKQNSQIDSKNGKKIKFNKKNIK